MHRLEQPRWHTLCSYLFAYLLLSSSPLAHFAQDDRRYAQRNPISAQQLYALSLKTESTPFISLPPTQSQQLIDGLDIAHSVTFAASTLTASSTCALTSNSLFDAKMTDTHSPAADNSHNTNSSNVNSTSNTSNSATSSTLNGNSPSTGQAPRALLTGTSNPELYSDKAKPRRNKKTDTQRSNNPDGFVGRRKGKNKKRVNGGKNKKKGKGNNMSKEVVSAAQRRIRDRLVRVDGRHAPCMAANALPPPKKRNTRNARRAALKKKNSSQEHKNDDADVVDEQDAQQAQRLERQSKAKIEAAAVDAYIEKHFDQRIKPSIGYWDRMSIFMDEKGVPYIKLAFP